MESSEIARIPVESPSDPAAIDEYVITHNGRLAYRVTTYPAALESDGDEEVAVVRVPVHPHLRLLP